MKQYRAYRLNEEGRVDGVPKIIACDDDASAIEQAKQLLDSHDIEVWQHDRIVMRLPKHK